MFILTLLHILECMIISHSPKPKSDLMSEASCSDSIQPPGSFCPELCHLFYPSSHTLLSHWVLAILVYRFSVTHGSLASGPLRLLFHKPEMLILWLGLSISCTERIPLDQLSLIPLFFVLALRLCHLQSSSHSVTNSLMYFFYLLTLCLSSKT